MSHIISEHASVAAADLGIELAKATQAALRKAITNAIGRGDWSDDEIRDRLVQRTYRNGREVWLLDRAPILEILPMKIELEGSGVTALIEIRQVNSHKSANA